MTVELEPDAVKKLESAKLNPQETLSDVVRRAEFPLKPQVARDFVTQPGLNNAPGDQRSGKIRLRVSLGGPQKAQRGVPTLRFVLK
jgi:hypothetical protein